MIKKKKKLFYVLKKAVVWPNEITEGTLTSSSMSSSFTVLFILALPLNYYSLSEMKVFCRRGQHTKSMLLETVGSSLVVTLTKHKLLLVTNIIFCYNPEANGKIAMASCREGTRVVL